MLYELQLSAPVTGIKGLESLEQACENALLNWGVVNPAFLFAMYEKDGLPLEKVLKNMITVKFIRPPLRKYEVENMYEKRKIITKSKGGTVRGKKRK